MTAPHRRQACVFSELVIESARRSLAQVPDGSTARPRKASAQQTLTRARNWRESPADSPHADSGTELLHARTAFDVNQRDLAIVTSQRHHPPIPRELGRGKPELERQGMGVNRAERSCIEDVNQHRHPLCAGEPADGTENVLHADKPVTVGEGVKGVEGDAVIGEALASRPVPSARDAPPTIPGPRVGPGRRRTGRTAWGPGEGRYTSCREAEWP